jgi:hypothetical protein
MKFLPQPEHFSRLFVLLVLLSSAASCVEQDEPSRSPITAQFSTATIALAENAGEQAISVSFTQPVSGEGEIVIKATTVVATCFSTTPIAEFNEIKLKVKRGDQQASFTMKPTDNAVLDGSKVVKFSIVSMSNGFIAGATTETIVTVSDDEAPVAASFPVNSKNFRESVPSSKIDIDLAGAAPADGVLVVKLESLSSYGVEYATQPAASNGKIFVPVTKGATSATIELYAVNDNVFKADRNISFKIIDATGGVTISTKDTFWCTITEDDGHQLSNISSIRSLYEGESLIITADTYFEGVVTSANNIPGGRIVVEDVTGALPVQLTSGQTAKRGDIILVNIKQGLLQEVQGVLEVSQVASFEKLGEDAVRANRMSIFDLLVAGESMESRTVQLTGVAFDAADGTITFGGDRILGSGLQSITVRTAPTTSFADEVVPEGLVNVTGIFAIRDGLYVLYPQESKDIRKSQFMIVR